MQKLEFLNLHNFKIEPTSNMSKMHSYEVLKINIASVSNSFVSSSVGHLLPHTIAIFSNKKNEEKDILNVIVF